MTTPMCPKCGSVKVSYFAASGSSGVTAICGEPDCGHHGRRSAFLTGGPQTGQSQHSNNHWRDGAALSMDGMQS